MERSQWDNIGNVLREFNYYPRVPHTAKQTFKNKGIVKMFSDKDNLLLKGSH